MAVILAFWDVEIRRTVVQNQPSQANSLQDLISNITRAKWTGGVAQVVEQLRCKHEALCSNPNLKKKSKG
jgi:hypothetical protein